MVEVRFLKLEKVIDKQEMGGGYNKTYHNGLELESYV